jgi:hypothetical protein
MMMTLRTVVLVLMVREDSRLDSSDVALGVTGRGRQASSE